MRANRNNTGARMQRKVTPPDERFAAKIAFGHGPDACWTWMAASSPGGYGKFQRGRRGDGLSLAHRASYEMFVGPIPEGLDIDHLCRNRACVNPAHLEPVTRSENLRRGVGVGGLRVKRGD